MRQENLSNPMIASLVFRLPMLGRRTVILLCVHVALTRNISMFLIHYQMQGGRDRVLKNSWLGLKMIMTRTENRILVAVSVIRIMSRLLSDMEWGFLKMQ